MNEKLKGALPTAIGVALLPPLWAVISGLIGIEFGWVALACGGIYVAAGDDIKNGIPISLAFLMGSIWGYIATKLLQYSKFNHYISLFIILCVMGFVCVILARTILEKLVYLPACLGSWGIALGTFSNINSDSMNIIFIKLLITMILGVWYVGVFNQLFQNYINRRIKNL